MAENYLNIFTVNYLLVFRVFELQIVTVKMEYVFNTANRADWVLQDNSFCGNTLIIWKWMLVMETQWSGKKALLK